MFATINGHFTRIVDVGAGPRTLVTHGGWTGNWELWEQQVSGDALVEDGGDMLFVDAWRGRCGLCLT